jgi:CheY-like chemotaxis protein
LALAKGIVELHGGSIRVHSDGPNQGSAFFVELPLSHNSIAPTVEKKTSPQNLDKKPKILIVEDNSDAARSLQMLLKLMGFDVQVALNGSAGLEAARFYRPDVIMSDIGLPGGIDGYTLARTLRADDELSSIRLIAVSGYGQQQDRTRSREAGFDQHLVKPVDLTQLKAALNALL